MAEDRCVGRGGSGASGRARAREHVRETVMRSKTTQVCQFVGSIPTRASNSIQRDSVIWACSRTPADGRGVCPKARPTSCENNRIGQVRYAGEAGGEAAKVRESSGGCGLRPNLSGPGSRIALTMASILEGIDSPGRVRKLSLPELEQLAAEIRERLITVLSSNGGHLGPNLGGVELTIALHYVFHTPSDSFLFDVSHQAYVHKLLTGRQDRFDTIRTPGGLNGFMLRTESPHDCYGAGHAGTALSAALGMAVARDKVGGKEHVVAVAGDAAFTCGITYEALNNIAHHTKRLIVVLNDNEWSIDKNVGAIASYLNKIVTSPRFDYLHDRAGKLVEKLGGVTARRMARKAEGVAKGMLWPSVIFEELGLKYFGPIDGHDIATLIKTFEFLKKQDRPVLLHVLTQKGKGFEPALQKQKKFHGLGPYDPETGETAPLGRRTYSEVFADTLVKLADYDPKVVAITAAMPNGTGLDRFQPHHPDKYFDVGIAEEHAVLFAAGLAAKGFKPFCAIYSTFLQRAFDPIVHDVCLQNLPVVFCMDRGGLSADDGPTHHGLFDISYLRAVPN